MVQTGGSGTLADPFSWENYNTSFPGPQFTLHYWRTGSTNNWGHISRSDIVGSVSNGVVTIAFIGVDIFTFNESDAFVSSGGGGGSNASSTSQKKVFCNFW